MQARDLMTRNLTTVGPQTSLADAIARMVNAGVSGLPVLDAQGNLVGIITEGDLLRRVETRTEKERPGWLEMLIGPAVLARDYVHAHGRQVGDLMSPLVTSITEDTELSEIVRLMEKHQFKRLPVVRDGALVGLVCRADLVRRLGRAMAEAEQAQKPMTDSAIRTALLAELARVPWANAHNATVEVKGGVVTLAGVVFAEGVRAAIRVAAQEIPGVRAVDDQMVWLEPVTGTTLV